MKSKKFAINSYLMKRKDAMLTFYEEDASSRPQLSSTTNIKCCCWLRFWSVRNVVSVYVYDCACTCNDQRFWVFCRYQIDKLVRKHLCSHRNTPLYKVYKLELDHKKKRKRRRYMCMRFYCTKPKMISLIPCLMLHHRLSKCSDTFYYINGFKCKRHQINLWAFYNIKRGWRLIVCKMFKSLNLMIHSNMYTIQKDAKQWCRSLIFHCGQDHLLLFLFYLPNQ